MTTSVVINNRKIEITDDGELYLDGVLMVPAAQAPIQFGEWDHKCEPFPVPQNPTATWPTYSQVDSFASLSFGELTGRVALLWEPCNQSFSDMFYGGHHCGYGQVSDKTGKVIFEAWYPGNYSEVMKKAQARVLDNMSPRPSHA